MDKKKDTKHAGFGPLSEELLRRKSGYAFLDELNSMQKEAALHDRGPLLILAGAGSGKTRVIIYRIAFLLMQGVPAHRILAVTFTNKATQEMRGRLDELAGSMGRSVWISTFHSLCARILRQEYAARGINAHFAIFDETDQKRLIADCIDEFDIDEKKFQPQLVASVINRAKDDLIDGASYGIYAGASRDMFRIKIAEIYGLYERKLRENNAMDFGDLIMKTVELFREDRQVCERYQERLEYIMVDEYQDTNHAQYIFTKMCAKLHKNICVVGDEDQSIYSWRGADIRNILDFEKDYPNVRVIKLERNYRSTRAILGAAHRLIRHNTARKEKNLWTENKEGQPVQHALFGNEHEEAQGIVREITKLADNYSLRDIAVFYRTNAQSRVLEDCLRMHNIGYQVVGSVRFYERREVRDLLAYLWVIENPDDSLHFRRIVNVPNRGLGKKSVALIEEYARSNNVSFYAAMRALGQRAGTKSIAQIEELMNHFGSVKSTISAYALLKEVIEKTGYMEYLVRDNAYEAENRMENVQELVSAVKEYETMYGESGLAGFLEQVSLSSDVDQYAEDRQTVTLMTLHLAKGLEFPVVFIAGMEEGLFPHGKALYDSSEMEEERRLCYVGITRARELAYFSGCKERMLYGSYRCNVPSRFIAEAGLAVLKEAPCKQERGERGKWQTGEEVFHPEFGKGRILECSGSEDDLRVKVLFASGQWRKFAVRYAPLTLCGREKRG